MREAPEPCVRGGGLVVSLTARVSSRASRVPQHCMPNIMQAPAMQAMTALEKHYYYISL